jgi:ParB family chromosome partitioning protein
MWKMHDRITDYIDEQTCKDEIESFSQYGQLVPVLGRQLRGDPEHDVELIFGARRLFVAQSLNCPLSVELRDIPDRDAIVAMDIENRQRKDVSPYERGRSFARWLQAGYFDAQDELARALNVSSSVVSRLLKLARLPAAIVEAFESPAEICETWGTSLMDALADSPRRQCIFQEARSIAGLAARPPARVVYTRLMAATAMGRKPRPRSHDEIVKCDNGRPLFRIRQQRDSIAFVLPIAMVSANVLNDTRQLIRGILTDQALHRARTQLVEHSTSIGPVRVGDTGVAR